MTVEYVDLKENLTVDGSHSQDPEKSAWTVRL